MSYQLTEGAIKTIMVGGEMASPVVQILGSKVISGNGANERYRLLISDGIHLNSFAMLATQLTPLVQNGALSEFTIVKITNYIMSVVKGDKKIMVILDLESVAKGEDVGMRIGNPTNFTDDNHNSTAPPAPKTVVPKVEAKPQPRVSVNETVLNTPTQLVKTHPIVSICPYQNNWTIKARVTSKSPIRTWSNSKSEGKLFSMDLVDESGEIRFTAFRDAVDKFYDMIQENKVYYISRCQLKIANKKFCTLNNDYEMTATDDTKIVPSNEEDLSIPTIQFNFSSLSSIQEAPPNHMIDLIGVCKSVSEVKQLTSRTTNKELKKRDITLVDQTQTAVVLTLWGNQAEEFTGENQPVVAIKGGRVGEFNGGKTVSLVGGSVFQVNPDIPEAHRLRGWFDCLTEDATFTSLSAKSDGGGMGKSILIGEAISNRLGCGDKPDYFSCYANVLHIRTERCVYKACPAPDCQKKVIDQNTGQYRCEKCNREYDNFKYRLMLSANIGDFSGTQWITLFQEAAEDLLQAKADDIGRWQESESPEFSEAFKRVTLKPFYFRLRAKMETFNDESRLKLTVYSVKRPDFKERCQMMLAEIKELSGISVK